MAKVSPFRTYQAKSLLDDFSGSAFSMSSNADMEVPHRISLKPFGSKRGFACRVELAQPTRKMLNAIVRILTFFIAPAFNLATFLYSAESRTPAPSELPPMMMPKGVVTEVEIGVWIWVVIIGVIVWVVGIRIIIWFGRRHLLGRRRSFCISALDLCNESLKRFERLVFFHR